MYMCINGIIKIGGCSLFFTAHDIPDGTAENIIENFNST